MSRPAPSTRRTSARSRSRRSCSRNLGLIVANLSWTHSILERACATGTRRCGAVLGRRAAFLAIALYVPSVRDLFRFASLGPRDLALAVGGRSLGVAWFEALKALPEPEGRAGGVGTAHGRARALRAHAALGAGGRASRPRRPNAIARADEGVDATHPGDLLHVWNWSYHYRLFGAERAGATRHCARAVETGSLDELGVALHRCQDIIAHGWLGLLSHVLDPARRPAGTIARQRVRERIETRSPRDAARRGGRARRAIRCRSR